MKKEFKIIIFFILASIFVSCEKNDLVNLKGSWVEIDTQTDTIVFSTNAKTGSFILYRGSEIKNGHKLPKAGSGPYNYEIFNESINLISGLSSSMESNDYYFKIIEPGKRFQIGVFTFFETGKAIMTFEKKDD